MKIKELINEMEYEILAGTKLLSRVVSMPSMAWRISARSMEAPFT